MIRIIAKIITFLGGLYFFLEFLLPEEIPLQEGSFKFGTYYQQVSIGLALLSSFAIGLGVLNILMIHGQRVFRSKKGIFPSIVLLCSFFITLVVQIGNWVYDEKLKNSWSDIQAISDYVHSSQDSLEVKKQKIESNLEIVMKKNLVPYGVDQLAYQMFLSKLLEESKKNIQNNDSNQLKTFVTNVSEFKKAAFLKAKKDKEQSFWGISDYLIFYGFFIPLGSSMFSILGFYITYAAYRSFRVKSLEASVMMFAALIVILGQIPQGVMYISEDLPQIRLWIIEYISTPAFRAIYFCSALAGLSLAVRMWFSMDKNPFLEK